MSKCVSEEKNASACELFVSGVSAPEIGVAAEFFQASTPKAVGSIEDVPIDSLSLNTAFMSCLKEDGMIKGALANVSLPFSAGP